MPATHPEVTVWTGARRFGDSARSVSQEFVRRAALLAGVLLAALVGPLWGHTLAMSSLSRARRRLENEGLVGLGEFLSPSVSRQQYADGVWRGLWRVHGTTLAFTLIQLPLVILAFVPAAIAGVLLAPVRLTYAGETGDVLVYGLTGAVAFFCFVVVFAQTALAYRLLSEAGRKLSLGYVARVSGEAWRVTLRELSSVIGLGLGTVAALVAMAAVLALSALLARVLELAAGSSIVLLWTGAVLGVFFLATLLDAVVAWADTAKTADVSADKSFSFGGWLRTWFGSIHAWFADKGLVAVGTAVCLVVGALTAIAALLTGNNFTSWVGVAWFAVTAAVLVALSFKRSGK